MSNPDVFAQCDAAEAERDRLREELRVERRVVEIACERLGALSADNETAWSISCGLHREAEAALNAKPAPAPVLVDDFTSALRSRPLPLPRWQCTTHPGAWVAATDVSRGDLEAKPPVCHFCNQPNVLLTEEPA